MKYLFLLLVLFNIAFYLWESGVNRPPPAAPAQADADADAERIVLVKELPAAPAAAQSTEEAPQPPAAAASAPPAPRQDNEAATPNPGACHRLGPFDGPEAADSALRKLGAQQAKAKRVKKPMAVETGYLILYPAADSPEAAQAKRKMLAEKGYKDAWVVVDGENRNAISLAAFKDKSHAEAALARFRAQGVEAELKPRIGNLDKWWLESRDAEGKAALEAIALPAGLDAAALKACE